jgi:hypothetical protein
MTESFLKKSAFFLSVFFWKWLLLLVGDGQLSADDSSLMAELVYQTHVSS